MTASAKLYYPDMQHFMLDVNGQKILCDGEGYLPELDAWSEGFVLAAAGLKSRGIDWPVSASPRVSIKPVDQCAV